MEVRKGMRDREQDVHQGRGLRQGKTGMLAAKMDADIVSPSSGRCEKRRQGDLAPFFFLCFLLDSAAILY